MAEWLKASALKAEELERVPWVQILLLPPIYPGKCERFNTMYVLFLDDVRKPDDVTWAAFPRDETTFIIRNYNSFVKHISLSGVPMFVCFDHDLAEEHYEIMQKESNGDPIKLIDGIVDYGPVKTGYDCAKWLVDYLSLIHI